MAEFSKNGSNVGVSLGADGWVLFLSFTPTHTLSSTSWLFSYQNIAGLQSPASRKY